MSQWLSRCVVAAAVVFSYQSMVQAVLITLDTGSGIETEFYDTFEAAPGSGPLTGHLVSPAAPQFWTGTGDANANNLIQNNTNNPSPGAFEGSQYALINRVNGSNWSMATNFYTYPITGMTVHAEWMAFVPAGAGNFAMNVGLAGGGGANTNNAAAVSTFSDGFVRVLNADNSAWVATTLQFTNGQWQKWEVDWTVGSSSLKVSVDGTSAIFNGASALGNGTTLIDKMYFATGGDGQSYYIDAVPEPSGFVLFAGLGTFVAGWTLRRKK